MHRTVVRIGHSFTLAAVGLLLVVMSGCARTPPPSPDATEVDEYLNGPSGERVELEYAFPGDEAPTVIQAEIYDGIVLIEGDIALGSYEELTSEASSLRPNAHGISTNYWPASTATAPYVYEIPYVISDGFSQTYVEQVIEPAIEHWNQNTAIRFVERDGEAAYVNIVPGDRCWSNTGVKGEEQKILLSESGCTRVATVVHELGHTVGLKHEHQRTDRDEYVEILWDNIQTDPIDQSSNFRLYSPGLPLGEYNYTSIMHYRRTSFGITDENGNRLETVRTLGDPIAPAAILTVGDLAGVRRLYPERDLPFADITNPASTLNVEEGDSVDFAADAVIDPTLDDRDLILTWTYDRNGVPFTFASTAIGETTSHRFCDGAHDVRVSAVLPSEGTLATDVVRVYVTDLGMTNPPELCAISVSIDQPIDGAVIPDGTALLLSATIADDHPETDDPLYPVVWRLNDAESGTIVSTGLQGSTKLGIGEHTIFVTYGSATDSVTVTVEDAGTISDPVAVIESPAKFATLNWEDYYDGSTLLPIPVVGSANDVEDGMLGGANLSWSWRVAGTLTWNEAVATGTSASLQIPLQTGNTSYVIRLIATDSDGSQGVAEHTITIVGPPN